MSFWGASFPLTSAMWHWWSVFDSKVIARNLPYFVGRFTSEMRLTSFSVFLRYFMRSFIVIILRLCFFANLNNSGVLAIVPSSFMISHITPAG